MRRQIWVYGLTNDEKPTKVLMLEEEVAARTAEAYPQFIYFYQTDPPLPRNEDHGSIDCSAEFGEEFIVEIVWNTDESGCRIDNEDDYESSFYGPFIDEEEAVEWMNAYPEFTEIYDMYVRHLNSVRGERKSV